MQTRIRQINCKPEVQPSYHTASVIDRSQKRTQSLLLIFIP